MPPFAKWAPAWLAAALLLSACSAEATSSTTTTQAPPTTGAGGYQVVMESFAFSPAELTVPVGSTVTWVNRHPANHNVVAQDGSFASPLFGPGETFSFTFSQPGEYRYVCSIHPGMEGTIIVTAP